MKTRETPPGPGRITTRRRGSGGAGLTARSQDADDYNSRGHAYSEKGDYDRAIKDFAEAIRLDPKNADGL